MRKSAFEPCLPTRGTKVTGPDWIHEIKHDGYRLIVEAALRNRATSFVLDGEAVLLGVDGISDFNGLRRPVAELDQR
jgi:bifunctional non-homologous end joining protein LigD